MGPVRIVAALLLASAAPAPGHAAFELRDAGPAFLGAVSTDGAWLPLYPEPSFAPGGNGDSSRAETPATWRVGGSRASLFDADGLTLDQVDLSLSQRSRAARFDYVALSGPGARESSARLTVEERVPRPVSLALRVERLDFSPQESERWGGWALGGRARGALGKRAETWVGADRLLRTSVLSRAGVSASFELGAAIHASAALLAILDRWEPDATHDPRVVLEIPLGDAARLRIGRGGNPGRIGIDLSARIGSLEVAWGRLDYAFGGKVTALRLGIVREKRRPAVEAGRR